MEKEHIGKLGLKNIGNTCYFNSCLQLLSHSGYFVKQIFIEAKNNKLNDFEKSILDLCLNKWISKNILYNPINIQKYIIQKNPIFKIGNQNDTSESLIYILDLFENKNISNTFKSEFNSIQKCKKCNNITKTNEIFNILSIDLIDDINNCLTNFQKEEELDGLVFCNKCKTKQEYLKKYENKYLADNLIIHIKRYSKNKNSYIKNNSEVKFHNKVNFDSNEYELRGFVIHTGRMNSGHYYFIGKNLINKWFLYNDSECTNKNIDIDNFKKNAYIFLYEKIKDN